jgi:hypothetical protein
MATKRVGVVPRDLFGPEVLSTEQTFVSVALLLLSHKSGPLLPELLPSVFFSRNTFLIYGRDVDPLARCSGLYL